MRTSFCVYFHSFKTQRQLPVTRWRSYSRLDSWPPLESCGSECVKERWRNINVLSFKSQNEFIRLYQRFIGLSLLSVVFNLLLHAASCRHTHQPLSRSFHSLIDLVLRCMECVCVKVCSKVNKHKRQNTRMLYPNDLVTIEWNERETARPQHRSSHLFLALERCIRCESLSFIRVCIALAHPPASGVTGLKELQLSDHGLVCIRFHLSNHRCVFILLFLSGAVPTVCQTELIASWKQTSGDQDKGETGDCEALGRLLWLICERNLKAQR